MPEMSRETWLDFCRGLALQRALYSNRLDIIEAMNPTAQVVLYRFKPEIELPSYCVVKNGGRVEVIINGTENSAQKFAHIKGYLGVTYGLGAANRAWWQVSPRLMEAIGPHLPEKTNNLTEVVFNGHSYGAALAQIIADREIDGGRNSQRIRVIALASPKPYTDGVPELRHRVDILRSINDPVTIYPPSSAPVWQTDPLLGVIPFPNRVGEWAHRGEIYSITSSGSLIDEEDEAEKFLELDRGLAFDQHALVAYWHRLERHGNQHGWTALPEYAVYKAYFVAADEVNKGQELSALLTWFPNSDEDPIWSWINFGVFASKGVSSMANPVVCKAFFESGGYGWSEEFYYAPQDTGSRTIPNAAAAFNLLLKQRLALFTAVVRYGPHIKLLSTRYNIDEENGKAYTDWAPAVTKPDESKARNFNGEIDAPFVGYLYRLFAGYENSRTILFRPIPSLAFFTVDNTKEIDHKSITDPLDAFCKFLAAQSVWAIKAMDKRVEPKRILEVRTATLANGNALLRVPAHGMALGDEIHVFSGKKEWKPIRGKWFIGDLTDANNLHILGDRVFPAGACDAKVRKVTYWYPLIDSGVKVRYTKRDTGRPIALGRGRR